MSEAAAVAVAAPAPTGPQTPAAPAPVVEQASPLQTPAPVVEGAAPAPAAPTEPNLEGLTGPEVKRAVRQHIRQEQSRRMAEAAKPTVTDTTTAAAPPAPAGAASGEATAAAPAPDGGRPRDPATGQFLPAAPTGATGEAGAPAAVGSQGSAGADSTAASGSPSEIRIEIPADHPLRGMGVESLHATDPQQERAIRALLNSHTRRAEVEQAQARHREMEEQIAERDARLAVAQERVRALIADSSKAAFYADVKTAYGEEYANRWLDGELRADEAQVAEKLKPYREQRAQQEQLQAAQQFVVSAEERARAYFPAWWTSTPGFQQAFAQGVETYDMAITRALERGQPVQPSVEELLTKFVQPLYIADPFVLDHIERMSAEQQRQAEAQRAEQEAAAERERQRIAAEAVEQFRQQAATTRRVTPPNPLGNLPGARGDQVSVSTEVDTSKMTVYELRQHYKAQARADAAARMRR